MDEEKTTTKRDEWQIKIGPLMKKILVRQREKIREATYGVESSSDYTAAEIIAKKIIENELM